MHQSTLQLLRTFVCTAIFLAASLGRLSAQTPPPPTAPPTATATVSPQTTSSPATTATPEIRLVSPKVTYPKKGETHYLLSIVGNNLGKSGDGKTILVFVNDNIVQQLDWIKTKPSSMKSQNAYGIFQRENQIDLWLPWPKYSGMLKLKVSVDDKVSDHFEILVSKIESKWKAAWLAALITLALLGLPLLIVSRNRGNVYKVGETQYGILAAFFLDKETDTYSLSKFQFYVWTAVAIFGYVYLALVESLVQGKAVFPEIPENLPAIILISAATGTLAVGITTAKGPKGAGDIHPTLGDFITAGGLVVAERFQFFIWTVLGAVTFLFFTISSDPATLHDLPKIPESFLQIMGISSLGYLGGKLARKPGPVIDEIQVDPPDATRAAAAEKLTLIISGQKLSLNAGLRIEDADVPVVAESPKPDPANPNQPVASAAVLRKDTTDSIKEEQGEFYKKLTFDIWNADSKWKKVGKHKVTIINGDGKAASWDYEIK